MRRGTLAAIGLVVLLFIAGVAAYWAFVPARSGPSGSAPTLFSYEQTGAYTYVARLTNNSLYGATNLTPGNGTLFTQITTWLNLTFVYRLAAAARFTALSELKLAVVLESPEWSKVVEQNQSNVSVLDGPAVTATMSVHLNIANVTSRVGVIEKETDYYPSAYEVALEPTINTVVQYDNVSEGASLAPTLLLNFTGNEIVPSRLSVNEPGNFLGAYDPTSSTGPTVVPYLLLAAASVGAVVLGLVSSRHGRPKGGPDLASLTRPYAEAIVETPSPPPAGPTVPVRTWEDLVKVADTLGCPILRLVPPGNAPAADGPVHFYVLADPVTYTYVHGPSSPGGARPATAAAAPTARRSPPPAGAVPPPASRAAAPAPARPPPSRTATALGTPAPRSAWGPAVLAQQPTAAPAHWDLGTFLARADQVRTAVRSMPASAASALAIEEAPDAMLTRAVALARQGQLPAAQAILRRLSQELSGETRPSPRRSPAWDRSGGSSPAPRGPGGAGGP